MTKEHGTPQQLLSECLLIEQHAFNQSMCQPGRKSHQNGYKVHTLNKGKKLEFIVFHHLRLWSISPNRREQSNLKRFPWNHQNSDDFTEGFASVKMHLIYRQAPFYTVLCDMLKQMCPHWSLILPLYTCYMPLNKWARTAKLINNRGHYSFKFIISPVI